MIKGQCLGGYTIQGHIRKRDENGVLCARLTGLHKFPVTLLLWVEGFAFGVVRILIGFARIRSVCISVRIANQFAGEAVYSRAICTISRSIANPGRIRANPFRLRIDNPSFAGYI